ncbi:putative nucleotidyltransferase with HDIG domain [Bacillus mesophilus]|uniref:HD family phosphohydrolase n=1 Tax=Bacillus mesophilus TaxID=1808955 RepID=A0A6M0Q9E0_9BACI|nr:HD family phosphohydrolase [Bacillus mesophilus]MBM7660795.1 putative nucleotidyltransferase with HDIG domain [Bacillus mesophilus]NEY71658.1 HD family phosphohydrolase [Bacillus mesophilus]
MNNIRKLLKYVTVFKNDHFLITFLYLLFATILFFSMYSNIRPEKLNLKLYAEAEKTIVSPALIQDVEMTEEKKNDAIQQVSDVYSMKKGYAQNQIDIIDAIFKAISDVETKIIDQGMAEIDETNSEEGLPSREELLAKVSFDEKIKKLDEALPSEVLLHEELSKEAVISLLSSSPEQRVLARDNAVTAVNNIMSQRIETQEVDSARERVNQELRYINVSNDLKQAIIELCRFAIVPNVVFDKEATNAKRQAAAESIEPDYILQGQIIVREGELIDEAVYRQLNLAGFLDNKDTSQPFLGLVLLILLFVSAVYFYFRDGKKEELKYTTIYILICSITIILMKIISLFQQINFSEIGYVVPVAMGAILIKLLINERLAMLASIILAISGSIIFNGGISSAFNFSIGIYFLISCIASIIFLGKHNQRAKILQTGLFVGIINFIVLSALVMLKNGHIVSFESTPYFIMSLLSGIVAAVLAIGLLPFFEAGFGILSTMRLIELSNPNHPLLRKILTETPGTYHHSVMVANLSEAACEAIGANGLLARVGSYYHDIGKTKRPQFFIENQMNRENPHDKISAQLSKTIITSHATDGAELLRLHKMPKEIVDIAEQHHGTTLLKYFYHKATQNSEKEVLEAEFRYAGPKAQTKEIAIIGIADSVEAAVRSMNNPSPHKIEGIINSIIKDRLQDGQLDECDITMKELDSIAKSFFETMQGIFHSRIEYPEVTKQKVKEA